MIAMTAQEEYALQIAEASAARMAAICPDAIDELTAAERKAQEVVERARARRDAKDDSIESLILAAKTRARTLSTASYGRAMVAVDLKNLGAVAAKAFFAAKLNPSRYADSLYENAVKDLERLTVLQPHLEAELASIDAECDQQLAEIKKTAKAERVDLETFRNYFFDSSKCVDGKTNQDQELLSLFNQGFFDDIA